MLGSQYNIDNTDQPTARVWYSREVVSVDLHTCYMAVN